MRARQLWVVAVVAACARTPSLPHPAVPAVTPPVETVAVPARVVPSQAELESTFLAVPSSAGVRDTITATSSETCMAGTPGAAAVADHLTTTLKGLGFTVETAEYDVLLPHPTRLAVTIHTRPPIELSLVEPLARAPMPEALTWNAYSASRTVKAPVVYVGTGSDPEYAAVAAAKVDVKGKVLLMRYGPLYRGAQIAAAERRGAAAVILYVDPKDDPVRPPQSVQRGTVVYYWQYTGDPETPGVASTKDVTRGNGASILPTIPVVTVTSVEAQKLLERMTGPSAGALAGTLAVPYRIGPGPITEVAVQLDGSRRTIRDVIATLPGETDELVLLGVHYDGWLYGALDPHSGTATLVEIARGLSKLAALGWKPRRTIVIGFWDAEEFGVIGSTEWVEDVKAKLQASAVAYFNIDTIKAGALTLQGAPELRDFIYGCSAGVTDPLTEAPFAPVFRDIGIGSDWTAFVHHAGVSSLQWQTGAGPGKYNVWHSGFDDIEWATTKADPELRFIPAFAQVMGLCALRLATDEVLPFDWTDTAAWVTAALDELARTTKLKLSRAEIDAALGAFAAVAVRSRTAACNRATVQVTRAFLAEDGLVDRPWYRNLLTGPNPDNGYGALLLPELAGARDQAALDRATTRLIAALRRATDVLERCAPAEPRMLPP